MTLFVRTARRTELTDAGAELLADARETLAAADRLGRRARVVGRGGLGAVSVGFVWSTLGGYLAPLVAAAGERHRQIELSVSQLRFVELIPALRRGDIDLADHAAARVRTRSWSNGVLNHEPLGDRAARGPPARAATGDRRSPSWQVEPLVLLARELIPSRVRCQPRGPGAPRHPARSDPPRQVPHPRRWRWSSAGLGIYYRTAASAAVPHPGVVYRELAGVSIRTMLVRRPEPPSPAVAAIAELIGRAVRRCGLRIERMPAGVWKRASPARSVRRRADPANTVTALAGSVALCPANACARAAVAGRRPV